MKHTKTRLIRWILLRLLRKRCPDMIPRSGERVAAVDCYIPYISDAHGNPYILIDSIDGDQILGREWNGTSFEHARSEPLAAVDGTRLHVERFLGIFEFRHKGLWQLFWRDFCGYNYLRTLMARLKYGIFRHKRLLRHTSFSVLKEIVTDRIEAGTKGVDVFIVMSHLHSPLWAIHPDKDRLQRHYQLILDSFESLGALTRPASAHMYVVTGTALSTLTEYENAERRHRDSLRLARTQLALTFALVVVAVIQLIPIFWP